jgi:RNA polymerase sigma factor (sigma-70 family)
MPAGSVRNLMDFVHRLASHPEAQEASDGQLLERFVTSRDEAAFRALLGRYGPVVLGVCRRLLGQAQDIEDAFQATFLVLVRRAGEIERGELLGNWLYGVALRTAARARSQAARRAARQQPLIEPAGNDTKEASDWRDLRTVLDEEIDRLPARYRLPFVLCYLEGKTNDEAARALSCPRGTVQSRLSWARERLRRRLTRRGLALSAGPIVTLLAENQLAASVPAELVEATLRLSLLFAAGETAAGAALAASGAVLARGVLRAMFFHKLKAVSLVVLAILVCGVSVAFWTRPAPAMMRADPNVPPSPPNQKTERRSEDESQHTAREEIKKSFQTGKAPKLIVELGNGGIEVTAGDRQGVEVNVLKQARRATEAEAREALKTINVKITQEDDIIRVIARPEEKEHWHNMGASAVITVPAAATVQLHTSNGAVKLVGGTGKADITTSNGSIDCKNRRGPIDVKTSNGSVKIEGASGKLAIHTSNGAVKIQDASGQLTIHTSNGPVEIHAAKASVHAETSNGAMHFTGSLDEGEHSFETRNGEIDIRLPADVQFRLDARTSLGHVSSTYPFKERTPSRRATSLQGTVGEHPTFSLKLRSSHGNIEVGRKE